MEDKLKLPTGRASSRCPHCRCSINNSDSKAALKQRRYREREKTAALAKKIGIELPGRLTIDEFLDYLTSEFIANVSELYAYESVPSEEDMLTDEYDDEFQKLEKKCDEFK